MQTNIQGKDLEITADIRAHVEKVCTTLEKLADAGSEALICDVEVGRTTEHHLQGKVFRAEVNFSAAGEYLRAEAEAETIISALDEVRDELKLALVHRKHKKQSLMRRTGAKLKDLLRFRRN